VPDLSDRDRNPAGLDLAELAVIADAVSTPYQAIRRSGLRSGDLAVVVGCGGIGGFAVQIAAALGARVVAIDSDPERLERLRPHGADLLLAAGLDFRAIKRALADFAEGLGIPSFRHHLFEASGTPGGQTTAFGLLGPGGHLSVIGFTPAKVELRLSNLMAFDATVQGNWACLPELYPEVLALVLEGAVALRPFVERRALGEIDAVFEALHARGAARRIVLVPERG
jgi:6-hydroxycyclohex-1-ene-1-carbonyl-CoA dehydrogenase